MFVNYGNVSYDNYGTGINGRSNYTAFNPKTGEFTQVFYINPDSRFIQAANNEYFNGTVGIIVRNKDINFNDTQVDFVNNNTSVDVVKVPSRTKMPGAVYENPVNGESDPNIKANLLEDGTISIDLGRNSIDNPYIVTIKSKIDPNVETINLGSSATIYGNGQADLTLANIIQFETGNTGGSGEEEKTYNLGDRVWLDDNKDGLQTDGEKGVEGVTVKLTGGDLTEAKTTKTDANGNYKFEGLKNGEYTVTFETPEGYEITKTNIGEDDEKDSDGLEVKATIKDADNMSVDLGLVKKEKPVEPEKPVTPENPSTPEEPEKPVTPEKPSTPEEPEKPVTPEKPSTPEEPEKPVTPEKPGTPEEPEKPVTPEKPGTPEEPEKPVTPEKPSKPEEPEKPVTPEKPGTPEEPEKPTTPEKPQNPQSPGTTNNPTKDEKVENPKTPTKTVETIKTHGSTKQASKNPKTGIGSSAGISGIAISSILASIGFEKKKKEDK